MHLVHPCCLCKLFLGSRAVFFVLGHEACHVQNPEKPLFVCIYSGPFNQYFGIELTF